tara:strand:- start:3325 stop:4908 length:1584 start_codon:yes stop_codon:yes gene_type:complete
MSDKLRKLKNLSDKQLVDRVNSLYSRGKNDDDEVGELFRRSKEKGFKVIPKWDTYEIEYAKGGDVESKLYNVEVINEKNNYSTDILPEEVSKKRAERIADKINNMKPKSAKADIPLPFAKGGMPDTMDTTPNKVGKVKFSLAKGEDFDIEVPEGKYRLFRDKPFNLPTKVMELYNKKTGYSRGNEKISVNDSDIVKKYQKEIQEFYNQDMSRFAKGGNVVDDISQEFYDMNIAEIDGEGIDDVRKLKAIIFELNNRLEEEKGILPFDSEAQGFDEDGNPYGIDNLPFAKGGNVVSPSGLVYVVRGRDKKGFVIAEEIAYSTKDAEKKSIKMTLEDKGNKIVDIKTEIFKSKNYAKGGVVKLENLKVEYNPKTGYISQKGEEDYHIDTFDGESVREWADTISSKDYDMMSKTDRKEIEKEIKYLEDEQLKFAKGGEIKKGNKYQLFNYDINGMTNYEIVDLGKVKNIEQVYLKPLDTENRKEIVIPKKMFLDILSKNKYAKGGEVKKKGNEMIMGGLAGILLGIFLNK